nr:UDP-glucose 4-epimerase GalE [Candidatus Gracilibacteria bacterium]
MKKNVLITGGLGYIGSHAVVEFEKNGYKTVIVDNLSNSSIEALIGIEKILGYKPDFFEVDIRDKNKLEEIFKKYNFDGVIHFAGLKAVGESCLKPLDYHDNNILGSIRLFELMDKYNVKNIIFSSSATVYKEKFVDKNFNGYTENDLTGDCTNPYGTTKFILEQILRDLSIHLKFRVMNLRYFNPIGAHTSGYIGEDPNGIPNNLLPYIMKVAIGELPYLNIFGNDYSTIDGTGVRDYIDVNDLIEGHIKAFQYIEKNNIDLGFFNIYNLGTGKGVSVLEILKTTEKVIGKEIPYKFVGRRDGDLAEVYCNREKAYKELGFKTKISLEESLRNSWKFYNNNK